MSQRCVLEKKKEKRSKIRTERSGTLRDVRERREVGNDCVLRRVESWFVGLVG